VKAVIPLIAPTLFVAFNAVAAYLAFTFAFGSTPQRCWKVPDMVTVPVWINGGREDGPRACEDTLGATARDGTSKPMCWEMVEKRGEECRR
jgi:hypothetical protein